MSTTRVQNSFQMKCCIHDYTFLFFSSLNFCLKLWGYFACDAWRFSVKFCAASLHQSGVRAMSRQDSWVTGAARAGARDTNTGTLWLICALFSRTLPRSPLTPMLEERTRKKKVLCLWFVSDGWLLVTLIPSWEECEAVDRLTAYIFPLMNCCCELLRINAGIDWCFVSVHICRF